MPSLVSYGSVLRDGSWNVLSYADKLFWSMNENGNKKYILVGFCLQPGIDRSAQNQVTQ